MCQDLIITSSDSNSEFSKLLFLRLESTERF